MTRNACIRLMAAMLALPFLFTGCVTDNTVDKGGTTTTNTPTTTTTVYQGVEGPEASTMEHFNLTNDLIKKDKWNQDFDMYMTYHDSGVTQITTGYAC